MTVLPESASLKDGMLSGAAETEPPDGLATGALSVAGEVPSFVREAAERIAAGHVMPRWHCKGGHAVSLPSVSEVLQILNRVEEAFFPCFRSRPCRSESDASGVVDSNLEWLYTALTSQIERALPFRWLGDYARAHSVPECVDVPWETARVVQEFFARLPGIRENLLLDVEAAYCGDPAAPSYAEVILSYPGLRAITAHRVAHELYRLNVPLLPRIMSEYVHSRTGIDIHPGAQIGSSFFVDHGTGVVIGETARVGDGVKIYQGVTLGARSFPLDDDGNPVKGVQRHPTIGNGVVIYAGVTILGGNVFIGDHCEIGAGATIMHRSSGETLTVGEHSIIGGNAWLTESVEPYSFVFQEHHQLTRVTTRRSHRRTAAATVR